MALPRMLVSCSFGRSSMRMARELKNRYSGEFDMRFVFANTGCEWEQTLVFGDRCDREFGLGVIWVEAVVHHGEEKGCTHRIVTFETASRNGEPFEEVIKKYGIPNKAYPHCTRELKLNPMRSYADSIGWHTGKYLRAVGIRVDEPHRIRKGAAHEGIIYPLAHDFPLTKPEINEEWEQQPFNLELEEHQGNCKWCWKKSFRKLAMIARETPDAFDFPMRMEMNHGLAGHNVDGTPRKFFRGNMATIDVLESALTTAIPMIMPDPDEDAGCTESCEAFT